MRPSESVNLRGVVGRMTDAELSVALQEAVHTHVVALHGIHGFNTCVVEEVIARLTRADRDEREAEGM